MQLRGAEQVSTCDVRQCLSETSAQELLDMLSPKLSRINWLTCLLLAFALFITPLAAVKTRAAEPVPERQASSNLEALSQYGVDLTEMARHGSRQTVNEYVAQIQSALRILARETR